LPPAYTVDAKGRPLHSWRTLLLPFLDQKPLYETIDLTKAWNDPANAEVCKTLVPVFQCPEGVDSANHTQYLAIVAPNGCFRPTGSRLLSEITDPPGETLMVIEVDSRRAVPWMSPADADEALVLSFSEKTPLPHSSGQHALFVDGSVAHVAATVPVAKRRAQITIASNDDSSWSN
jgi:hypothetical protein